MFLSFEGIDGSGKTTLAHRVAGRLRRQGHSVVEVREPGGTPVGEAVRDLLLDPDCSISPRAEVLLFSAARAHLVDTVVRPALGRGDVVIADRFYDSTTAYQGGGRGVIEWTQAEMLHSFATDGLHPDLTFLVDVDLQTAVARRAGQHSDRIESSGAAFFEAVRSMYLEIARRSPDRVIVLDGRHSPEELEREVATRLLTSTN